MKKTLLALACFCSLLFFGCASKPENAPELPAEPQPQIEEVAQEESSSEETEDENSELSTESEENSEAAAEPEDDFPEAELNSELEDIEEPVVITLDPEIIPEPEDTATDSETENNEPPAAEEPIEVEVPPAIEVIEVTEDTTVLLSDEPQSDSEDVSDAGSDEDDVILVDEENSSNDDIIDITDENQEDSVDSEPVEEVEIVPSRKVTVKKQEYIDITYPGTGWIFMGLTDGSKDLSYFGRKLGTADTKFTLQAKNAGTKIVHFYKNDLLTGNYIDDYIEIEVLAEKGSNKTHVEAPAYKQPVPAKAKELLKPKVSTETPSEQQMPAPEKTPDVKESETKAPEPVPAAAPLTPAEKEEKVSEPATNIDTNTLLKEAEVLYNEKEYKLALDKLNIFFENATTKRDKALYLKGQILEAKSALQDIKGAMEAYNTLIKNYPASLLWDDANKRVIYLKRFYFGG